MKFAIVTFLLSLCPLFGQMSMTPGQTAQFTATASYSDNTTQLLTNVPDTYGDAVIWTAQTGSISSTGLYTAPSAAGTDSIYALSSSSNAGYIPVKSNVMSIVVAPIVNPFSSSYLGTPNNQNTLIAGNTLQFSVFCVYSNGAATDNCQSSGLTYTWSTSSSTVMTISSTGLVTSVGPGSAYIQAKFSNGKASSVWYVTVSSNATLTGIALAAAANTNIRLGVAIQLNATCTYSDGTSDPCNTADAHGNKISFWGVQPTSTTLANISSTGLATALGVGTARFIAVIGTLQSNALPVTITNNKSLKTK